MLITEPHITPARNLQISDVILAYIHRHHRGLQIGRRQSSALLCLGRFLPSAEAGRWLPPTARRVFCAWTMLSAMRAMRQRS